MFPRSTQADDDITTPTVNNIPSKKSTKTAETRPTTSPVKTQRFDENEFKDLRQGSWSGFEEFEDDDEQEETTTAKATSPKTTSRKTTMATKMSTRQEKQLDLSREAKPNKTATTQIFETSLETTSPQSTEDRETKRRRYYKVLIDAVEKMPLENTEQKMNNTRL